MGGPLKGFNLGALKGLPRSLLKCFIAPFEPPWGPPAAAAGGAPKLNTQGGGPPPGGPLPSLTLRESLALARYRCMQWSPPPGAPGRGPGGPPGGALVGSLGRAVGEVLGALLGYKKGALPFKPPAIWPEPFSVPEGPPPPNAEDIPKGLLRVQALGHGTFLLQTSGTPGGPLGPLSILTDPFFSKRAGPWGRIGRK